MASVKVDIDTDEDVTRNIKEHAKSKGLRIMSQKVIRNRYVEDVVGCKIIIPMSQEHLALTPGFWPDGIECRHWEHLPPSKNRRRNYGYNKGNSDYYEQEDQDSYMNRYD